MSETKPGYYLCDCTVNPDGSYTMFSPRHPACTCPSTRIAVAELSFTKKQLENSNAERESVNKELAQLKHEREEANAERQRYSEQLAKLTSEMENSQAEKERMKEDLKKLAQESENTKAHADMKATPDINTDTNTNTNIKSQKAITERKNPKHKNYTGHVNTDLEEIVYDDPSTRPLYTRVYSPIFGLGHSLSHGLGLSVLYGGGARVAREMSKAVRRVGKALLKGFWKFGGGMGRVTREVAKGMRRMQKAADKDERKMQKAMAKSSWRFWR